MSYKVLIVEDLPELIEAMSDFYRGTSGSGFEPVRSDDEDNFNPAIDAQCVSLNDMPEGT